MRGTTDLSAVLAGLESKEILRVDGHHWSFRSDLIREVAYGILTKADRARRHYGIAYYLSHTVDRSQPGRRPSGRHGGVPPTGRPPTWPPSWARSRASRRRSPSRPSTGWRRRPAGPRWPRPCRSPNGSTARRCAWSTAAPSTRRVQPAARSGRRRGRDARPRRRPAPMSTRPTPWPSPSTTRAAWPGRCWCGGEVERDNGDLAAAVGTLRRPSSASATLGDHRGAADAMREIGMAQIFLGNNDEAEASIRAALAVVARGRRPPGRGLGPAAPGLDLVRRGSLGRSREPAHPLGRDLRRARRRRRSRAGPPACWPSSGSTRATSTRPGRSASRCWSRPASGATAGARA